MLMFAQIVSWLIFLVAKFVSADFGDLNSMYLKAETLMAEAETYTLPVNNDAYFANQINNDTIDVGNFDFIIVGGGTAGGVLANRLTETQFNVLVIEAGLPAPDTSAVLGLAPYHIYSPFNWGFNTTTQINACLASINQSCVYHRGKGVGGSSLINAGFYNRGNAKDFDKWAELGNSGWAYEDVLPYFKKSENANFTVNIDRKYHGFGGLQTISAAQETRNLTPAILNGFRELGLTELDYNGEYQVGYSKSQIFSTYNIRSSTNYSFIRPAIARKNLVIISESLATKIVIKDLKAVGVKFTRSGQNYYARASKEVIVSCGSIMSPHLLMLSGIGPKEELQKHDIEVIADLPVGKNFLDHIMFAALLFRTDEVYYNESLKCQLEAWEKNRLPLNLGYGSGVMAFWDFNNDSIPDVEFFQMGADKSLGSLFNRVSPEFAAGFDDFNSLTDFTIAVSLLHPSSVGRVTLASNSPRDYPQINPNYLSNTSDIEMLYRGIEVALRLNGTAAFKEIGARLIPFKFPDCDQMYQVLSEDWWKCAIKHLGATTFHPIGTTSMGINSETSVVDPTLRIHGVEGLRVVDAGVMPDHISGHTNAATVMIAEKAADMIKECHL